MVNTNFKRNISFVSLRSHGMWIVTFWLQTASPPQVMRSIEQASLICCTAQLWLNGIPWLRLVHLWISSLCGPLPTALLLLWVFFTFEKLNPGFKSPHMFLFATFIIFIIQSNCCSHPNCRKNNHCVCGGTCTCSSVVYWMPPWGKKVMKCLSQFTHSLSNSFSFSAEPKF